MIASCCISSKSQSSTWANPVSESQTGRDYKATRDEMMEVVVVQIGTTTRAKLQSDHHRQNINTQFYRLDALPVAQSTASGPVAQLREAVEAAASGR